MASPRLVLFEGFPGTGKSTTAQWLARGLTRSGRRARWVYEEEAPHPVARGYSAAETRSITDFATAYWARWDALARSAADADETVVLDGAFVQWPMIVLLRRNVGANVVVEFIVRLGERLAPRATLIYTPSPDSDRALTELGERRGISWLLRHAMTVESTPFARARGTRGMTALFTYWRAHAGASDQAVQQLAMPKLVLDPAASWSARRTAVAASVGIEPGDTDGVRLDEAGRYVGRYRGRGSRQAARITVDDGGLVVDGLLWPRTPLIPKARDVFDVAGWPYEATFSGDAATFTVTGPALSWGRPPTAFDRVD